MYLLHFCIYCIADTLFFPDQMVVYKFSRMEDAMQAQETLQYPLLVLVHSAAEATAEEQAGNPSVAEALVKSSFGCKEFSKDFPFHLIKGSSAQREAFAAVLAIGLMNNVVLVHEVQEGTAAFENLSAVAPILNNPIPRVHLLPHQRSASRPPVIFASNNLTPIRLIKALQNLLLCPVPQSTSFNPGNLEVGVPRQLTSLIQSVELLNGEVGKIRSAQACLPPARTATVARAPVNPFSSPSSSTKTSLTSTQPSAATSVSEEKKPAPQCVPSSCSGGTCTSKAKAAAPFDGEGKKRGPLPACEESSPPTQKSKPENVSIRCLLPSGKHLMVEDLLPSESSISTKVRPVVQESVGHNDFDLIFMGPPPRRLNREKDEVSTLETIGIVRSCSLRVVIVEDKHSPPQESAPVPEKAEKQMKPPRGGDDLLKSFMSMLRRRGSSLNPSAPIPTPVGSSANKPYQYKPEKKIRTLDDVLVSQSNDSTEIEENGGPGLNQSPGDLQSMLKRLYNRSRGEEEPLGDEEGESDDSQEQPPSKFVGQGHILGRSGSHPSTKEE